MLRILNRFFPRFVTQYFILLPVPGMKNAVIQIPTCCEDHLDPQLPSMKKTFFNLFGWHVMVSVYFRPPSEKAPHAS